MAFIDDLKERIKKLQQQQPQTELKPQPTTIKATPTTTFKIGESLIPEQGYTQSTVPVKTDIKSPLTTIKPKTLPQTLPQKTSPQLFQNKIITTPLGEFSKTTTPVLEKEIHPSEIPKELLGKYYQASSKIGTGLAKSVLSTFFGLGNLFLNLFPEDAKQKGKEVYSQLQSKLAPVGGYEKIGSVIGDISQTAITSNLLKEALVSVPSFANFAKQFPKISEAITLGTTGTAIGQIKVPSDYTWKNRLKQAIIDFPEWAAWSLVGGIPKKEIWKYFPAYFSIGYLSSLMEGKSHKDALINGLGNAAISSIFKLAEVPKNVIDIEKQRAQQVLDEYGIKTYDDYIRTVRQYHPELYGSETYGTNDYSHLTRINSAWNLATKDPKQIEKSIMQEFSELWRELTQKPISAERALTIANNIPIGLTIKNIGGKPEEGKEIKPSIPKELEPLAEEARKYPSAEEFYNTYASTINKINQNLQARYKFEKVPLTKNEKKLSSIINEIKGKIPMNQSELTDFYNQATKGIKEVKQETKITPKVLQQKAMEALKQEVQPTIQPTTLPETPQKIPSETPPSKKTPIKSYENLSELKAELEKIKAGNESAQYGEVLRGYVAGERDVRMAEANQLREQLERILTPREQEALTFYRDFKGKETELANLLNDPAFDRYKQVINLALHPTEAMLKADEAITQFYQKTLDEGRKLGFLDSTIPDEKYITHLLAPSDEELAPKNRLIRRAKISRTTPFARTRTYDTVADAIKAGVKVRTINALDALTIYGQKHAIAASTKLFVNQLKDSALGKWGFSGSENIPSDWVPLDPSNKYFRNVIPFINSEGKPSFAYQDFYVPKKIAEALKPLIDTDFTGTIPGFSKTRLYQSYLKGIQLGLSAFHIRALNITALNNEGLTGLIKSYFKDIKSPEFLENEKDFIRYGGQTPILGRTIEAYKGLQDKSVPSREDILKHIPLIKQIDSFSKELTKLTFDIMQRKFKVQDYALKVSQWIAKHPNASEIDLSAAKRSIAKEVNASYGGLNWEALGWSQSSVNVARFLMLAPDWTFSNFFNAKYSFEGGPAGTAARKFWIRSILTGAILTYLTSTLINGKAPKLKFHNFTNVYLGKDKYGKDIFQNLFFAGAPQDAINLINNIADFGVIQGFAQTLAAKASPTIKTGIQVLTNRNYLGQEIVPRGMGPVAGTARALFAYGTSLSPIPFSLSTIAQMFLDPKQQYTMPEYILALMGTRPRHLVPPGMREITSGKKKGQLVPAKPKVERPLWEQITTGKQYEPTKRRKIIY